MGLLDNTTQKSYYEGSDHGNYQFVSLENIINQFLVAYVGEEKIIGKASRTDVAFYAQRALAELSFDTFKSVKSQEIELPSSLTMMLPQDYVNYTKISWSDSAGVKHPLYPTKHTSNPFPILQEEDGDYDFLIDETTGFLSNYNFESSTNLPTTGSSLNQWVRKGPFSQPTGDSISINNNKLEFIHGSKAFSASGSYSGSTTSRVYMVQQKIEVTGTTYIDLSATVTSATASSGIKGTGLVRVGVTTVEPSSFNNVGVNFNANVTNPDLTSDNNGYFKCAMIDPNIFNLVDSDGDASYVEFLDGTTSTLSLDGIDITNIPTDVNGKKFLYIIIISTVNDFTTASTSSTLSTNTIDSVVITGDQAVDYLQEESESTTWGNYKSHTPEDNINKYDDGTYDLILGERYGIHPQHAQVNGSFYIDNLKGLIHFSSNVSGKTVILDYISDSLGTDGEMQVHKFAEEAMYKWIMYAILSTRANTPEYIVRRYQKEKFAATRQAKLRLSNIKLEELTQVLRGKSKHIKH